MITLRQTRDQVDHDAVTRFMDSLGRAVTGPGRIYFTGGVSAVLKGWRNMTVDLDVMADPEPQGFFESLSKLTEAPRMNAEMKCPAHFIPELPGWRERSEGFGGHGLLDFCHYDFYSQALSKVERDHVRDRLDVSQMLALGLITRERLAVFPLESSPG